jgi:hypothetical protein
MTRLQRGDRGLEAAVFGRREFFERGGAGGSFHESRPLTS